MNRTIGEILKSRGFITPEMLDKALKTQKQNGGMLGLILVDLRYITVNQLTEVLKQQNEN